MRWAALVILGALAGSAHADKADVLFKKGKKLLGQKKYQEACEAFEESDKLDPGIGAKLNVARCLEEWGRLATALRWYHDAEDMAKAAKDQRAKKIHTLAEELDASVPRLTIKVPPGTPAKAVKLDGNAVDAQTLGSEQRVDPGPHRIEYVVDGKPMSKVIPIERGGSSEITLEAPVEGKVKDPVAVKPVKPVDTESHEPPAAHPGRLRKIAGLGVAGAGVVAMGVAGYVTLGAKSDYDDAIKTRCNGDKTMCDSDGLRLTRDAKSTANTMTAVTIVGVVAVAGGLVLFFTAPNEAPATDEHALYLAPTAGRDGAGVVFGGAF